MDLPSIAVSDSETDDGEVELFMPSQAYKTAAEVDYARFFDPEHLNDALNSPTFHGTSRPYPPLPEGKPPESEIHAADMRASDHPPSTTATHVEAAVQPTEAKTSNSAAAAAAASHTCARHESTRPAAALAPSAPAPRTTAVSTSAETTPPTARAAAPLLVEPAISPPAAPAPPAAAAAPEVPVLSAPSILDDHDLDALLHRLSRTASAIGAAAAPRAPPVAIVANSRFIGSLADSSVVAAQAVANCAAAGDDQIVSPVYQPRWAKEAHGSTATAGRNHRSDNQSAPANQAGRLVGRYAGPEGSSSSSSSSTLDSPNKTRLWVKPRPVIKIDLRSDTRDKNLSAGAAASSMQMPPRFGFGRAGRSTGATPSSGVPAVAAAVTMSAATATPAATVEADISDWWEGRAGGKQQQSESSDSDDEWLQFRQQHFKHKISQQQQ